MQQILGADLFFQGRGALAAALRALDVGPGDGVALQAFTCVAVPEAIVGIGAIPVFVDIEPGGVNMDPRRLRAALGAGTVRAVVIQHTFGVPADPVLFAIAAEHGAVTIEDCCHALTSRAGGWTVGDRGDAAFTSFEWGKPVIAGLGGAAWSSRPEIAARIAATARALRQPPLTQLKIALQYVAFRVLYRPGVYWVIRDLQRLASRKGLSVGNFGSGEAGAWSADADRLGWKMWRFGPALARRAARRLQRRGTAARAWAARYDEAIAGIDGASPVRVPPDAHVDWVRYPVVLHGVDKARALAGARAARLEMAGWYETPVHPLDEVQLKEVGYETGSCPEAEARCTELVSLSVTGPVRPARLERLASVLRDAARQS